MGTGAWPGSGGDPRAATPGQLGFEAPDSSSGTRLLPRKIFPSPTGEDSPSPALTPCLTRREQLGVPTACVLCPLPVRSG